MQIGFSTGAIAFGDFRLGLERLRPFGLAAVELSALREQELVPLLEALPDLELDGYRYVALHAPGRYSSQSEAKIVEAIQTVADRFQAVVVHPDSVHDRSLWRSLGETICFENMDKRKRIGRSAEELASLFAAFPQAGLCMDLGHAWQVDRTMAEARQIARNFRDRIRQLHVSEVNTMSEHVPLTVASVTAFRRVLDLLPDVPWILEAVVPPTKIGDEIAYVRESLGKIEQMIPD